MTKKNFKLLIGTIPLKLIVQEFVFEQWYKKILSLYKRLDFESNALSLSATIWWLIKHYFLLRGKHYENEVFLLISSCNKGIVKVICFLWCIPTLWNYFYQLNMSSEASHNTKKFKKNPEVVLKCLELIATHDKMRRVSQITSTIFIPRNK